MKRGVRRDLRDKPEDLLRGARDQQVRTVGENPFGDFDDLFGGLPLTENDFRKSDAQLAVVIEAAKLAVLHRQRRPPRWARRPAAATRLHIRQHLFDGISVHAADSSMGTRI